MRKNYVFAITILLFSLFVWMSYWFYLEYRPVEYNNGTFVELPKEKIFADRERLA